MEVWFVSVAVKVDQVNSKSYRSVSACAMDKTRQKSQCSL